MNNEELVELYQQGDKQALDKLIEGNGGIVRKLAIKYNNINDLLEFDDLIQAGYIGLINAANKYDNTLENKANFIMRLSSGWRWKNFDSEVGNVWFFDGNKSTIFYKIDYNNSIIY